MGRPSRANRSDGDPNIGCRFHTEEPRQALVDGGFILGKSEAAEWRSRQSGPRSTSWKASSSTALTHKIAVFDANCLVIRRLDAAAIEESESRRSLRPVTPEAAG